MSRGFSLVELSIVLVILGLLVGGVLTGQSLIRAAELRSVATDIEKYQVALHTFHDKYFALPGDMPNAVRFWGAQAGGQADGKDATCAALTTAATGTATCNGNGDGKIVGNATSVASGYEIFRAWQHLANAGLLEGYYGGVGDGGDPDASVPGTNIPALKISNGGVGFWNTPDAFNDPAGNWYPLPRWGNVLVVGKTNNGSSPVSPIFRPEEAWNIDTKIDDGKPGYGWIVGWQKNSSVLPNCTTSDDPTIAEWDVSSSSLICSFIARLEKI